MMRSLTISIDRRWTWWSLWIGVTTALYLCISTPLRAATADTAMTPSRLELLMETLQGKVVLVDYWATWCPPCRTAAPELDMIYRRHRDEGFAVVGISFDREERPVQKFIARHDLSYPIYIGTAGLKRVEGVSVLPTTILVGRDGVIVDRFIGYLPQETLEEKINVLLAQNP